MSIVNKEHRLKIGVMGSASGPQIENEHARKLATELGKEIGKRNYIFINGACPGLPNDALLGALDEGAFTLGISPAFSMHAHIHEYKSPHAHDLLIYTGMGFMERDIINIRSSDAVIIIGGGIGTLNELTIAYEEGRPIGVLTNTGGISNHVEHIIENLCQRKVAPNMVFDDDPVVLMDKLEVVVEKYPLPIHEDGRVVDADIPEPRREPRSILENETSKLEGVRSNEPGTAG
ncbi:LOG family protein [Candidatus Peregrinibacteria bacterium]|jgi:uncharacterized protein (TIGR00725 family)|nr:LOG family protein [Candidatus Peregrinibacteria bacterium]MBT3598650.1 LOG family protein [Candidatus Peregrinibacteria bacterium]MBT6730951.1 LOG family protein [Candidatus Peregrinibacteria bacterium]MBT7009908.1 LOG family protein [Candidatus Peregrinibacteria bacterium]MBT7344693.1 LOG family protein [Candidatus Peregrinibacteria bacterium]